MTTGQIPETWLQSRPPKVRFLLDSALILALVGLGLLNQRPYSNWFYLIVALGIGMSAYRSFLDGDKPRIPTNPPLEIEAARIEGIFAAISSTIVFFAVMVAMFGEWSHWPVAIFGGAVMGVHRYRWERGQRTPMTPLLVALAVFLVLMTVIVLVISNAKH